MLELIIKYMKEKGITGYKLSQLTGMHNAFVYDVLNGKRPATANTMNKFLSALNLEALITLKEKDHE